MTTSFDNFASQYNTQMGENGDFNHQYAIDPALFELIDLEVFAKIKNPKIYDVGCGNGYLARFLKSKFPESQIFASDISENLVKFAQEKDPSTLELSQENNSSNSNYSNLQFDKNPNSKTSKINYLVCGGADFDNFSKLENGTFDLIFANMSLHYIEDLESFRAGVLRLLKTHGKFVFTTAHPFGDLKLFSDKPKNQLTKNEMVQIAQNYLTNQSQEVFFDEFPILIHKKSISFYVNFFSDLKLEKMLEIPKMKLQNGKIINTQIPAYYVLSLTKIRLFSPKNKNLKP